VVLLAAGIWANQNLRPRSEPPPASPTPNTAAVAEVRTPVPQVALTSTPKPLLLAAYETMTPTAVPARAPVTTLTANGEPTATARPTLDPVSVAEIDQAYDKYWQVRSQALLNLDKSHLAEAMGGAHLNSISQRIDELKIEQRAIKTDVDHESRVVSLSGDIAQLVDDYISNSVYVDPVSNQPLTDPSSDELQVLYTLNKTAGTWRVVDSVRAP
ncbi:MAG TPA: hypothetical protein VGQ62_22820, partial [Chloroflexota bacterium]|nr:hypothetical protein [Chloroflexota bacterium]